MQNLGYNDFTSFARRRAENWEHTFRNQSSNCSLCNPNDPADSWAFWPAEGPASVPLLFSELSWEKLILMLSSASIFVPETVSLCFWWTIHLWNLSTDSWVYRDRSTWGSKCVFLRLRRNKNQAMYKYKYSKRGKKNTFWLNILLCIPKWQDLINSVFLLWGYIFMTSKVNLEVESMGPLASVEVLWLLVPPDLFQYVLHGLLGLALIIAWGGLASSHSWGRTLPLHPP